MRVFNCNLAVLHRIPPNPIQFYFLRSIFAAYSGVTAFRRWSVHAVLW